MSRKTRMVGAMMALALVAVPATAIGDAKNKAGRMTGGGHAPGTMAGGAAAKVTHGFELYCKTSVVPQRLEVNWSGGNRFHLTKLTYSTCEEYDDIDQENPSAPFDTYIGKGTVRINVVSGATATWTFVDGGEPGGGKDRMQIVIKDASGATVLTVNAALTNGNHQAHRVTGSKA